MDYFMPTRLHAGEGCIDRHKDELHALGERCLLVVSGQAAKASGALADVQAALEACGIASVTWDGVAENPPVAGCIEAGRAAGIEHPEPERGARTHFIMPS